MLKLRMCYLRLFLLVAVLKSGNIAGDSRLRRAVDGEDLHLKHKDVVRANFGRRSTSTVAKLRGDVHLPQVTFSNDKKKSLLKETYKCEAQRGQCLHFSMLLVAFVNLNTVRR